MEITHLRTKNIGMKAITDTSQPISKISYRQQLSTFQHEDQQETKNEKQNEAIAIPLNETDESTHCFRTKLKRKIKSPNETCIGIGQSLGKRKTKTAKQHHRYHHSNSKHCICTNKEKVT